MKIVINTIHGGFSLSPKAISELGKRGVSVDSWGRDIARDDKDLVEVVEKLGTRADGAFARLEVIEIPDGVLWQIEEYDGWEWVAEQHRVWRHDE